MTLEETTRQLASFIRDPEHADGPAGIEARRLNIYRDLFYNNIEGFIRSGFPVIRTLFDNDAWHNLVRDFMIHHTCHTPYFLEISQEFLLYLSNPRNKRDDEPPFLRELAHYEWVELALDVADEDLTAIAFQPKGDLLDNIPVLSPLAWSLAYQYPVHKIGVSYQPSQAPAAATYLLVYRDSNDDVGFMEINSVTARMIEILLQEQSLTGRQVLEQIATELNHSDPQQVIAGGFEILKQLRSLDIILGVEI